VTPFRRHPLKMATVPDDGLVLPAGSDLNRPERGVTPGVVGLPRQGRVNLQVAGRAPVS
jgi:hypothetical protein